VALIQKQNNFMNLSASLVTDTDSNEWDFFCSIRLLQTSHDTRSNHFPYLYSLKILQSTDLLFYLLSLIRYTYRCCFFFSWVGEYTRMQTQLL